MLRDNEIIEQAKRYGAIHAKIVPSHQIVVAHWVRLKCMFGCSDYGKWRTCPPYTPDADLMKSILNEYRKVLLMTSQDHNTATKLAVDMMFWFYSRGNFKAFPLGSGHCRLCRQCDINNCKHPELAYPSMEACSIDVFATAETNKIPLKDNNGNPLHLCAVLIF